MNETEDLEMKEPISSGVSPPTLTFKNMELNQISFCALLKTEVKQSQGRN